MHQASLAGPQDIGTLKQVNRDRHAARALSWFGTVAVLFTVAQLVLVSPGLGLGWDETVYVSQVSPHAPAAFFSAPRARGITLLAAPVTELTTSLTVLRWWLSSLSGAALFLGLWVWRRLLPVPVLALAGALFATLWITLFYGPQVMPNLWVAFAALIATGCFLRAVRDRRDRSALLGMAAAVAVAALMRPTDAVWLAAPLVVTALSVRAWRRPAVVCALVVGGAAGAAEWIIEAYAAYGGLSGRLHRASEIQGGLGWHLGFGHQVRALEGRSLCRPCDVPWRQPIASVWWFALPVFVVGGMVAAVRVRQTAAVFVASLTGLSMAAPYLFTIDYAAPRFLLPAYALLMLPVALCVIRLITAVRPERRRLVGWMAALLLVTHVAVQYAILHGVVSRSRATRVAVARIASELDRQGVRPPCTVTGTEAVRIAFRAGCSSRQPTGHDGSISRQALLVMAERRPVAVLVAPGRPAPAYARGWRSRELPRSRGMAGMRVYLSPSARP